MKEVTKNEMKSLVESKYLQNTKRGFVDSNGNIVGFYRTKNKRYIEDKYADIAKDLS